ncbi:MAG: hypothetical protein RMJ97_03920 [Raineya sp.]|nr:hypothetical protein [Raineya sp.]MDW8296010.1 hypothetical protein [Raineya sp.]
MQKKHLFFWRNYPYKFLLYTLLVITFFSLIAMLISRHWGYQWLYEWKKIITTQTQEINLETFERGLLQIDFFVPSYFQQYLFLATDLKIPLWASQVWWIAVCLAVSFLGASSSFFKRIYFLFSATLFIVFLITLQINLIGIFKNYAQWLWAAICILLFVGTNYYFHAFGQKYSFLQRFLANFILWLLMNLLIFFFAVESNPTLYFTGYGIVLPALVTITTIFLVSSEIPYLVASLTISQPRKISFHLFTIVYLANLFFLYLRNSKQLKTDIFLIDDFYILAISLVAGFWGVRHNPLFQLIVPEKMRIWVYLAMVLITNATLFYFNAVANEDAIAACEDFITYSHAGFAIALWFYVVFNIPKIDFQIASQNFSQIFYGFQEQKPIPWYLARGLGFMLMGLMIYKENGTTLNQSIAAYFNGIGDLFAESPRETERLLADNFYDSALAKDMICHRLWVSKASLIGRRQKINEQEIDARIRMLQEALSRDPQVFTYALLAQEYINKNQIPRAISYYLQGIEKFPKNPFICNNLGILYSLESKIDSAYFYLQKAQSFTKQPLDIQANILALLARKTFLKADTLSKIPAQNDQVYTCNLLATFNNYQKSLNLPFSVGFARKNLEDTSKLSKNQAVYLYNFLTANLQDTLALHVANQLLNTRQNITFNDFLLQAKRNHFFKKNYHQQAIEASRFLVYISAADYEYDYVKHLLYLGQAWQAVQAVEKLQKNEFAKQRKEDINYLWAIALSEDRNLEECAGLWQLVALDSLHPERKQIADLMFKIHYADKNKWQEYSDSVRYGMIYYKTDIEPKLKMQIAESIQNPTLQTKAFAEIANQLLQEGKVSEADEFLQKLPKNLSASTNAKSELIWVKMKIAFYKQDLNTLKNLVEGERIVKWYEPYQKFFKGVVLEKNQPDVAYNLYQEAIWGNPFEMMFYPNMVALANELDKNPQGKAYDWAMQAVRFLELHPTAWKLYFEQCLKAELWEYAQEALTKIESLAPQDFPRYKAMLDEKKR